MRSFGGPLVVGIFEALALLLVARKMGLKDVVTILGKSIATVSPSKWQKLQRKILLTLQLGRHLSTATIEFHRLCDLNVESNASGSVS